MNSEQTICYVSLGSNLGNRGANLLLAVRGLMEAHLSVTRLSAIYETTPVGVENHGKYLNLVAEVCVKNVTPEQMLARMLRVEYLLGRRREMPKAPRTVDLDLIFFGDLQYKSDFLTVPHPQMHLRKFVLVPLKEIAPLAVHPTFRKTVRELLAETPDNSEIYRFQPK